MIKTKIQWSWKFRLPISNARLPGVSALQRAPGCRAGCLPGLGTTGDGTDTQLASAKTSGHHRTVANPNSIVIPRLAFWLPRLAALGLRCTRDATQGLSLPGQFARALPQGSEERGIFVRLIAKSNSGSTQADSSRLMTCLFLAQKKYKNLRFTRSFKMLASDSIGWKSNFEKQSSFSTGTLAFQPAPVNAMNNNTLTLNLRLKSRTEEHKVRLLTWFQSYWRLQKHDVCNRFTYSLKPIKQWLHLKRFVTIMNIIIVVGHKRLGLVPVLK